MQIRTRLTLQFSGIFAFILLTFSIAIYQFSDIHRANDFYKRIYNRAQITAQFVLEKDETSVAEHQQTLKQYYQTLPGEIVEVFDSRNKLVFAEGEGRLQVSDRLLDQIRSKGMVQLELDTRQMVGIFYEDNQGGFVIIASSIDAYSLDKLQNLKLLLWIGFLSSMILVLFAGWLFSKQALLPISRVVSEVERINASDLHRRLSNADGKDEIAHLSQTFNKMLDRLETAFEMQNTFVSNASHELRTPLTAMIGELEVALMKKREPAEYERALQSTLEEARLLAELSNGLLQIANASFDVSKIKLVPLRFDEMVWAAQAEAQKRHRGSIIHLQFSDLPDDEAMLMIRGNEALLLIALINIFENAIKFSQGTADVYANMKARNHQLVLEVMDRGRGITETDLKNVFMPFFRAENVRDITGHGIGLPLAERIIKLHGGSIQVFSKINEGTTVCITLPSTTVSLKI